MTARHPPRQRRLLVDFTGLVGRMWRWIGASWRNLATVVLLGLAAPVGAAAGWDSRHHPHWLVAAAVIAVLGALAQLSRPVPPSISPGAAVVTLGPPHGHPSHHTAQPGATRDQAGTSFAVFSEWAEAVELCLFDEAGAERRVSLSKSDTHMWHGSVPDVGPGQRYGYRVHGPYDPARGHRFNPAKLLLDPYARAIEGVVDWHESVYGYRVGTDDTVPDGRDSAVHMPRSVVTDNAFDWGDDHRLEVPWADTVIYEAHVRGFTRQHPAIPRHQRGTYAAMGSEPVIRYLKDLGVTTLELLPVQHFTGSSWLVQRGLTNYWGYHPIGYFAPEAGYSASGVRGEQVHEFKAMVRSLHTAGIEVVLDVVYNHTSEEDHRGPHLSFRGIDNRTYYRLVHGDQRHYLDYSGCGNTLNVRHPEVHALIIDSLRYWVGEMHVDGFRLDMASALARSLHEVDRLSAFFDLINQDPVISRVKLIAEPWDVGEGGYHVGRFPSGWAEWNDRYRDTLRDFWRGTPRPRAELARRLTGSCDLYQSDGRRPHASINFVTAHDTFTLHDLVSYNDKHNEANGEGNRDGSDDNRSWNCGAEGPTGDPEIIELRERQKRNLLTSLLLSAGVPMLLAGDELGRSQQGNNNPYCHDNEISWIDWQLDERRKTLLEFTRHLIALRAAHPVFRRRKPVQGQEIRGSGAKDIGWFTPDGTEMDEAQWREPEIYTLGVFLNGKASFRYGTWNERIIDDSFLLLLNGGTAPARFTLPGAPWATEYQVVIDTNAPATKNDAISPAKMPGDAIQLEARSVVVLRTRPPNE